MPFIPFHSSGLFIWVKSDWKSVWCDDYSTSFNIPFSASTLKINTLHLKERIRSYSCSGQNLLLIWHTLHLPCYIIKYYLHIILLQFHNFFHPFAFDSTRQRHYLPFRLLSSIGGGQSLSSCSRRREEAEKDDGIGGDEEDKWKGYELFEQWAQYSFFRSFFLIIKKIIKQKLQFEFCMSQRFVRKLFFFF